MCMCSAEDESTRTLAPDPGWASNSSHRRAVMIFSTCMIPLESDCKRIVVCQLGNCGFIRRVSLQF